MSRSRIREIKRRGTAAKRAGSLMELPILIFKIASLVIVTGSFIIYLINLPDSISYFTSRAESESLTVTFGE